MAADPKGSHRKGAAEESGMNRRRLLAWLSGFGLLGSAS